MIGNQIFQAICNLAALIQDLCQKLLDLATSIGDMPQIEGLALTRWCDETGTTGFSSVVIDEETGLPTTYYFDAAMAPIAEAPAGGVCVPDSDTKCTDVDGCIDGVYTRLVLNALTGEIVNTIDLTALGFGDCPCPEIVEAVVEGRILSAEGVTAVVKGDFGGETSLRLLDATDGDLGTDTVTKSNFDAGSQNTTLSMTNEVPATAAKVARVTAAKK